MVEDGKKGVFGFGGGEEGEAVVTAEGEEVEVAGGLTTLQAWGHGLSSHRRFGEGVTKSLAIFGTLRKACDIVADTTKVISYTVSAWGEDDET